MLSLANNKNLYFTWRVGPLGTRSADPECRFAQGFVILLRHHSSYKKDVGRTQGLATDVICNILSYY